MTTRPSGQLFRLFKHLLMENNYPFKWLDELVEFRLDPLSAAFSGPKDRELEELRAAVAAALEEIYTSLNAHVFLLFSPKDALPVIRAFRDATAWLSLRAEQNLVAATDHASRQANHYLLCGLKELRLRIEQKYEVLSNHPRPDQAGAGPAEDCKVLLKLSVDQFAIILKAADDTRILASRSLSMVFRSVIPHISTTKTEHVSWKSARSSTYKMAENDKTAAIAALMQLIEHIRTY